MIPILKIRRKPSQITAFGEPHHWWLVKRGPTTICEALRPELLLTNGTLPWARKAQPVGKGVLFRVHVGAADTAYLPFPGRVTKRAFMAQKPAQEAQEASEKLLAPFPPLQTSFFLPTLVLIMFWAGYEFCENVLELNHWSHDRYNSFENSVCFLTTQEDYIETDDKKVFPLRWTAPELVTSFQDRLLTAEQTKYSNIWYVSVLPLIRLFLNKGPLPSL